MLFSNVAGLAVEELRSKSRLRLYQNDFAAWKWDVLGFRTYEKMQHIADTALFGGLSRTVVKSANGTAKSFEVGCMIAWSASVFDPGDTVSIISAPSVPQLEKVIFAYLKSNYGRAAERGFRLPGRIDESLAWVFDDPVVGKKFLAFGRKPPEQDAVSVFQGVRSQTGRTNVFFDEAGGMSRQMFTAAEAVMTGGEARFVGIGNPDNAGTEFQKIFSDPKLSAEYNTFTISAFELPTLTGERVYPRTVEGDEMEARMLASLTQRSWVEHKQRIWGEKDARYLSKVMGEFPGDGDTSFFPQRIIDLAHETVIVPESDRVVLGVDLARFGQDESVIYENRGGRLRLRDSWGKADALVSARRVHAVAMEEGAECVCIDSAGIGGPIFDFLEGMEEFSDKCYYLVGIDGGVRSSDASRWLNSRAENHDRLRTLMVDGKIDLDFEDTELAEQLMNLTYKFTPRGAIQISSKDDMKTVMDGSPDRLDAAIYSVFDVDSLLGRVPVGTVVTVDPEVVDVLGFEDYIRGPGRPLL